MASKEELLNSINSDMRLYKSFFMKIYGFELSYPGFAQEAIWRLQELGCIRAEEYYREFVAEYKQNQEKAMKSVAKWFRRECERDYENLKRKADRECQEKKQIDIRTQKKKELLLKKRQLLQKKLNLSTGN